MTKPFLAKFLSATLLLPVLNPLSALAEGPGQPAVPGVTFTKVQDLDPNKKVDDRPIRQKWAVVVGTSKFKNERLKTKDSFANNKAARDFHDYLVSPHAGRFPSKHVRLITEHNATKHNIIDTIGKQWLGPLANKDDLVVVFISANAFPTTDGNAYLVSFDTALDNIYGTCLSIGDLVSTLRENVKSDRVVLIVQAPYSGAVDLKPPKQIKVVGGPPAQSPSSGYVVLSSAQRDQESSGDIFSTNLVKALEENEGLIGIREAFNKAKAQTEEQTRATALQTPVFKTDWKGKDLVVGTPAAEEESEIPTNIQGYLAAEAHYFRANDLVTKGNLEEAITAYQKAVEADPTYADAMADYATILALRGDNQKASELYQKAIALRPNDSLYRANYARVLSQLGRLDESRQQLETAYTVNPKDKVVLAALAGTLIKEKDPQSAATLLTEAVNVYPKDSELHDRLSYALAKIGKLDMALQHADTAVKLDPNSISARMNLGSIQLANGNMHEAVETYKQATALAPKDANAHYFFSQSLEKSGDLDKAKAELIMFLELAPSNDPRREKAQEHLNHLK